MLSEWRVAESPRTMPCEHKNGKGEWVPCGTKLRVKIKEPGVYWRWCFKCGTLTYYSLTPYTDQETHKGVLMFRWCTRTDYLAWLGQEYVNCDAAFNLALWGESGAQATLQQLNGLADLLASGEQVVGYGQVNRAQSLDGGSTMPGTSVPPG